MTAPLLRLAGLAKSYAGLEVVAPLDLDLAAGSFTAILGPSGCGKSTLLRMIGGFVPPTSGRIEIDGQDVTALPPEQRPTNMVFQNHGLFPHMSVEENIGFGLSIARRPQAERRRRVDEALQLVRLEGRGREPVTKLSGGQQQRVALARAIIMRPKILLLDEPLSALDLKLRQAMQSELARIHREIGGTFLFVTHDQTEAFSLADRIVVMNAGRVAQAGRPSEIYRRPASMFVAGFVGDVNVLSHGATSNILRPENITLAATPSPQSKPAVLVSLIMLGAQLRCEVRLADGRLLLVQQPDTEDCHGWQTGQTLHASWQDKDVVTVSA